MPEIKNTFMAGKMNKDADERLVPKGEYRDAMNIQVSTSEGSDVGAVENLLGNMLLTSLYTVPFDSRCVGAIADGLLDFSESISKEMEASVLIGRNLNLQTFKFNRMVPINKLNL